MTLAQQLEAMGRTRRLLMNLEQNLIDQSRPITRLTIELSDGSKAWFNPDINSWEVAS